MQFDELLQNKATQTATFYQIADIWVCASLVYKTSMEKMNRHSIRF